MIEELKAIIGPNENILYTGKPNKKCYLFESIFNPMLPFAILWAIIDFGIIGSTAFSNMPGEFTTFMLGFMALHLMPVWIYLGGVLFSFRRYRNTAYVVTDRAIYISGGILNRTILTKPFAEMSHIDLHRGIFDQMFGVGDVIATSSQLAPNGKTASMKISSIENYIEVYNLVKKLQTDIYTDIMYPNAKRPEENPGYNTKYKGL